MKRRVSLYVGLWLLLLAACQIDQDKHVNTQKVRFKTTHSSVLFFKNVRQIAYDKYENKATKLDSYRLKERNQAENLPVINVAIMHNWLADEAYALVEPNAFFADMDTIKVNWKNQQNNGEYIFYFGSKEKHYLFLSQLYQSLQNKDQLWIQTQQGQVAFLTNQADREALRKTLLDYFRLVGAVQ